MIKNHFKIASRYLWKNRLFTSLNIFGLAIGVSACWIIYRIVSYEFSYEQKLSAKESIYRLVTGRVFDEKESYYGGVSAPIYQGVREEVSGVANVVPLYGRWINSLEIPQDDGQPLLIEDPQGVIATDSAYFDMVAYTWLAGNKRSAFAHPDNVVLTESRAKSYFPNTKPHDIVGKTMLYNDSLRKTVSGIVQDLDYPTEFVAQEFLYLKPTAYPLVEWTNTNGTDKLYLQIDQAADTTKVLAQINALVDQKWKRFQEDTKPTYEFKRWFVLESLTNMHFTTHINERGVRKASKPVLFGLMGIGAFLLLLACINYINLSTAQIPQRSKEIGVRKTLGGSSKSLIVQLLSETTIIVALAAFLAYGFQKLGLYLLTDMIPEGALLYNKDLITTLFITGLLLLTILLSGIYPAWLVTRVNPINIFKPGVSRNNGKQNLSLRKGLIVFQYVIAQCFIIGALIMGQQLNYTLHKDLGFDKEAVLLIDIPWKVLFNDAYKGKEQVLAEELKKELGIRMVSRGKAPLVQGFSSSPYIYSSPDISAPVNRQLQKKVVDTDYLQFYDMQLLAGRNLHATDTVSELIINETAAKAYGFAQPQDAIGKILTQSDRPYPIVGVVKDFHSQDFYTEIQPLALMTAAGSMGTINVKLNPDPSTWQSTIQHMQQHWNSIYPPDTFHYQFYDQNIETLYQQERNMAQLINMATAISIIISCLGLFGLATLTAFQRTKEIGIRKVLGATVSGIVGLLSKDFVKLVLLAIIIATPIAWWTMNKWLEDFAYKIEIQWWMFALAGLMAVVVAIFTVATQAIKAAMANPVESLRDE
ncbi:ABC transporter permease [Olivibacter sitiensis]|uniref:ABC transporter permease n=1 Tax=Olivibacter sitiensis TaxID=376470 RepID=UPI000426F7D7|nr:ABC transporter permease [Olivibacter sitiensis]